MNEVLKINRLFSENVVLQRQKPITIWGIYDGEEMVEVSFMENTVNAIIDGNIWKAVLPAMEVARNQTLTVRAGINTLEIHNIHVGEVWMAGGQSNMEFHMRYDQDYWDIVETCDNDDIRFFDQPKACYLEQEEDFDYSRMGFWRICNKENLEYFSAVGYAFAARVWKELGIPVGIIGCNKGGSTTQSWMSEEYLEKHGKVWLDATKEEIAQIDYEAYKKEVRHLQSMNWGNPFADINNERLMYGIGADEQSKLCEEFKKLPIPPVHYDNRPACYYDNMLKKVAGVTLRGVIWYQGESEVFHVECYEKIFQDMIDCWRETLGENLPFYCVQLAPFQNWMDCYGTDFPEIRKIQQIVANKKERVYLVSTSDVGMRYDIHPKRKQPVGIRLAMSALKYQYGRAIQADAPVATAVRGLNNNLYIDFAGDMEAMLVEGEQICELQLFGTDMRSERELSFDATDYEIDGKTVILKNANIGNRRVSRVVFAGKDYYQVNLFGNNGIPAMPFDLDVTI